MQLAKNHGNKEIPLAILSRILAQSCITLCLNYIGRVTHDCASILDSIAKGIPRMVYSYIYIQMIFAAYFSWFTYKCSYAHACMGGTAPLSCVSLVKWR